MLFADFRRILITMLLWGGGLAAAVSAQSTAQNAPPRYQILGIAVEGAADDNGRQFIQNASGLRVGQEIALPVDEALGEAIRKLYAIGTYSDVQILNERTVGQGVFLRIRVQEESRLGNIELEGLKRGERADLNEQIPLLRGRPIRTADVERSRQVIRSYFVERGFRLVQVDVQRRPGEEGRDDLTFTVTKGPRVEIGDVVIEGNEAFSDRRLERRLKGTKERRWWRFWGRETFKPDKFDEDKERLLTYYQNRGYYGARIVSDSIFVVEDGRPQLTVVLRVEEGPQYRVRNVHFEGNTQYTDEQLAQALGFERGEVYNRKKFDQNLYYAQDHSDISSLYNDQGYLRFNVQPTILEVPGDSLDFFFEINEGDVYTFGQIDIRGNTKTKDYVIRRELRTVPGESYSRQAIERTIRELIQLTYFDQEKLAGGPGFEINEEEKTVDLTYNLAETGGDQLELSGGWGGYQGLLLQAGVRFNNFSIQGLFDRESWRPIPSGDGQQLALQVQTNGRAYQNYSLSFTEPWFRGRQTPVGFSIGYTYNGFRYRYFGEEITSGNAFKSVYGRVFYRQRLKWPDDFFQLGTDLGYRLYDVTGESLSRSFGLPVGISQELTVTQSLTRNSLNNPIFPSAGASVGLSVQVAPPVPGFIQYHKWQLDQQWYAPLSNRFSLGFTGNFGYIGSLTGDPVDFQRFLVGGSPLDAQGSIRGYGKDILFMRGYPFAAISPRRDGNAVGGRIVNKFSTEFQWMAVTSPQFQLAPYLFLDGANTWDRFEDYNPARLYRAAGFGARIFLPILGLVDLNYGYQIDPFEPRSSVSESGQPQWRFQFSLGGGQ